MSGAQTATQAAEATTTDSLSILDQVIGATKQTAPDQTTDLVKNLVEQAMAGTVTFDKNLTAHIRACDCRHRPQAVRATQRDHSQPQVHQA